MRKLLSLIFLVAMSFSLFAQEKEDITKKPEPLQAKDFAFPDYKETKLSNGLKLFIVKDDEQPTFSIRLLIPGGSSLENKNGVADLTTDLMMKGAGKLSALDIANTLDGIGADVNVSTNSDYIAVSASGLKKHLNKILEIFADVLLRPTFPEDEFDKLIPQKLAGLKQSKANPSSIAANMARRVIFGDMHPYGNYATEASLKDIKLEDVKSYYKAVFKPNDASIIVVGDVTEPEIVSALNKALDGWKSGQKASMTMPEPKPMPIGVYFINRPGSVQSTLMITTKGLPYNDPEFEIQGLGSAIMGGGFGSRLFRTLREKYSYTYSPSAMLSQMKYGNRFSCQADVRNSVTDSAITVVLDLMRDLATEPSEETEISRVKRFRVGQYMMSFENSSFLASLIQNADFMGIPIDRVKNYPSRYMNYSAYQVKNVAEKLMNPQNAYIIVVGNADVKSKLEKFGKVYEFDLDLNPLTGEKAKFEKVSLDAKELLENYVKALGGKDALAKVKTLITESKTTLAISGQEFKGQMIMKNMSPNKFFMDLDLKITKQTTWSDGKEFWSKDPSGLNKKEGEELETAIFDATLFNHTKLIDLGYKCLVLGKQGTDIQMKVVSPKGTESTYYFDSESFLLKKIESMLKSKDGDLPVTDIFSNYIDVDGVKLPSVNETTNPMYTLKFEHTYKSNQPIDEKEFKPAQ